MKNVKEIVKEISKLRLKGFSPTEISKKVNIAETQVYRIMSNLDSPIPRMPSLKSQKEKNNKKRYP